MATTVDELLRKPFPGRSHAEKLKILSGNRPRPCLQMFLNYKNEHGDFEEGTVMYDKIKWLTGCEIRQKMFCWPCLLFMSSGKWVSGTSKLHYIRGHYKQHEKEEEHLESVFKLQLFKMENALDSNEVTSVSNCNFHALKYVIGAICCMINDTILKKEKYKYNTLEVSDCINYLNGLSSSAYDALDLLQKYPKTINDLVDAITIVLKEAIMKETRKSTYASIILSEHAIHRKKSQLSTVLRYVMDGKVCERFVGFTNSIGFRLQHYNIAEHFLNVTKVYDIQEKLLALSVDGAVLSASQLSNLFQLDEFQSKYFVPCYFHGFGQVLMQSVSHLEDCGLFLKTLGAIESYFKNENNFHKLESILFREIPHLKNKQWYSTTPFVVFLSIYRKHVVLHFNNELTVSEFLSPVDISKINTFKDFLGDLKNIFLLKMLGKLFLNNFDENTDFATGKFGKIFDKEKFFKFQSSCEKFQTNGFSGLWIEANMEMIGEEAPQSLRIEALNNPVKTIYADLFEEIMDQIMKEVEFRSKNIQRLAFCDLLNRSSLGNLVFNSQLVTLLLHEKGFDRETLNSEIMIVNGDKSLLSNKSVHELVETLHNYNLSDVFTQLYKLAEFTLSIPFLSPSKDMSHKTTKLKQIDEFSYIPQVAEIPSGEISILCVEKIMLKDLQCLESFYDDVIGKYYEMKNNNGFEQVS